jgi:1-acyl-sn-glycerol-3-phosphate acyltransferase
VRVRRLQQKRGWVFALAASVLKPLFFLTTKPEWHDGLKIPATGGCVIALNHVTKIDPLTAAHFVYDHGRLPRYLAKSDLFKKQPLKKIMVDASQIPVQRLSANAVGAFDAAVAAVEAGECIVVYPEGTITRDPDMWPMKGKSGAARIALATGCPVIPVGHWGAHALLAPYSKRPDLFPRKKIVVKAGDPVDLSDLLDREPTAAVVNEATERIMAAITSLVEDIRGEQAPAERFDPRRAGVSEIGNPHARKKPREGA